MTETVRTPRQRREPIEAVLMGERRHLTNLAYRLLGSLAEAEDVVQETYARWFAQPSGQRDAVESAGAWLTTVAGRICLDQLRSARARRERYVGEWIPEPLPDRTEWTSGAAAADPAERVTLDESVSMAFLVVLESMTAAQRVAFVLHDVFAYQFDEVADIVGRSPAACRQLAASARRRVDRTRSSIGPAGRHGDVVRRFRLAWQAGDIDAIIGLLDPNATVTADGGGLANATLRPVVGAERIANRLFNFSGRFRDATILQRTVNGQPGLVSIRDGVVDTVCAFEIAGDRIVHLWAVRNPEKLRGWRCG